MLMARRARRHAVILCRVVNLTLHSGNGEAYCRVVMSVKPNAGYFAPVLPPENLVHHVSDTVLVLVGRVGGIVMLIAVLVVAWVLCLTGLLACLQYVKDTQDTLRRLERSAPALQVALAPDGTEPFGMEVAFDADNLIRAPVDSEVLAMLGTKTTTTRLVGRQLCCRCWQASTQQAGSLDVARASVYVCVCGTALA